MKQSIWTCFEIALKSEKAYANPFLDVDVTAVFTGPGGRELKRLAYWDGEGVWKVRAALTEVGEWTYDIAASDGNPDFTASGAIECVPYEGEKDIYRHGFLRVGPQGRYLIYDDGTPFFWLGDTHWTFVTEERWDESNCPKYASQFKACLDIRVEQNYTVYQSNFRDGKDYHLFGRYEEYLQDSENGLIPNLELMQKNVDPKMQYIAEAGLVNVIGWTWGSAICREGMVERYKLLAKYLIARYGAYPVVWSLAGEVPGYFPGQQQEMADKWREVALETVKWDTYGQLQSVHQAAGVPFTEVYMGEKWYDFAMTQGGHGDFEIWGGNYSAYHAKFPRMPIVESESRYEGALSQEGLTRVVTDVMVRNTAYNAMQNGCCGYTYGVNGVWELQWEAGVGGIGWGDMAWWDGLELPGAQQLSYMKAMYESVKWYKLRPIQHLVDLPLFNESLRKRDEAFFTADDEMTTVVGYFQPTSMKFCTIHGLPFRSYTAKWFDPETGVYSVITEDARPEKGVWALPRPENMFRSARKDAVLILTANAE